MDLVKKVQRFLSYWYIRYLVATELYMVEPWEKVVIHIIFGIVFWAFWYFNYNFVVSAIGQLRKESSPYTEHMQ